MPDREGSAKRPSNRRAGPVAIVDDDPGLRRLVQEWLRQEGVDTVEFAGGREFLADQPGRFGAICLDLMLGDMDGLDLLRQIRREHDTPVILVTAEDDVATAVEATRSGAYDYLVKPVAKASLVGALDRALEKKALSVDVANLKRTLDDRVLHDAVVGDSPPMRELARQVQRVLDSDVVVAVLGESGTGKELVARAIHLNGRRREGPFVAINCAAIPESLHESELFGHERGAFTGAVGTHRGRFEQAQGGTLFLDEVGEMSPFTQASLLRALQERTVRRVGGTTEVNVDVRIVCATNRDLMAEVKEGRFREDLYFRLVVFPIRLPPLRQRREDIPALVAHFIQKFSADVPAEVSHFTADALETLMNYEWPGNVRELENVVHRAMLAAEGTEVGREQLPPDVRTRDLPLVQAETTDLLERIGLGSDRVLPMREIERRAIQLALEQTGGSVEKAAKLLGMGRATLYRRLAHYEKGGAETGDGA